MVTAVYLLNRAPTKSLAGRTLYEAWHDVKPAVHHLRTFGCVVHVKNVKPHLKKLDDRSTKMVLLGYEAGAKAYRVYDPMGDVVFDEAARWNWDEAVEGEGGGSDVFTVAFQDGIDYAEGGALRLHRQRLTSLQPRRQSTLPRLWCRPRLERLQRLHRPR